MPLSLTRGLHRFLGRLKSPEADTRQEAPLRSQLFSAEQMQRHGRALAKSHCLREDTARDQLLARLADNAQVLDRASGLLTGAVHSGRSLTPAGEWLLDNYYLIEEQIGMARRHLPPRYSRELPQLANENMSGLPRVYDIALNAISHGDGRVDAQGLNRYLTAYQTVTPLTLGELWAVPIMLRLALIENLRRIAVRLIDDRQDRNQADLWADRLTAAAESDPKSLVLVIADMVRSDPPRSSSFVAEFARRLQGKSAALALPLTWVGQWLDDFDQSIEQLVQGENQQQAAAQVSMSNTIGSLRFLATMDWREFVETLSVVEQTLRQDPSGTHGEMDFATRDHYRHIVERIARRGKLSEIAVAGKVVEFAQARANLAGKDDLAAHVGYYLIDEGRPAIEQALGLRGALPRIRRTARRVPLLAYIAPGVLIVALCTLGLFTQAPAALAAGWLWLATVLAVIAYSDLAVALVNRAATMFIPPRALPRLDFSAGIPAQMRTLVAVPTLVGSVEGIEKLLEALEVRFLANRDDNLHFALLSDFFDADSEVLPGDRAVLLAAEQGIASLNARYAPERGDRFFLFHRARKWNPREGAWMGAERKRGKLGALNAYLRGVRSDEQGRPLFLCVAGNTEVLRTVRYVITLDTDTQLPRDVARELVGTLAHPLNRARFDERRRVVTRGYGILQPRVGVSMGAQRGSRYAGLYGSEPGIDPYTRAVSDVYQDLFGEGSFVGKGIYDVDAFEHALQGRMPDNRILSHDLLEGCYTRAGLVSDIQLYEDYPSRYAVDVKRRHRWIRGDWQLLPWLLPSVPLRRSLSGDRSHCPADRAPVRRRERNPLSLLSRGKIFDNLRRSLVPASLTTLLIVGWAFAMDPLAWTAWLLAIVLVPPLLASLIDLANHPADIPLGAHLRHAARSAGRNVATAPLVIACLPYEAFFSLDAIVRTLWRLVISRRRLLQWSPSSEVERTLGDTLAGSLRMMWFAPAFGSAVAAWLAWMRPDALWVAAPLLVLWLISPALMWWLGRPRSRAQAQLDDAQHRFLGRLARRTWAFFETHVTADDHWLPPDNVQEHPTLLVARRTSPTNIGLSLLADLAAFDFGYLPAGAAMQRSANTLATLEKLQRHRGHFLNWYDTQTLAPLPPRYVSAVDSGNLAAHLLTLRQGLLEMRSAPVISHVVFRGLSDTLGLVRETAPPGTADDAIAECAQALAGACLQPPAGADGIMRTLAALQAHADALAASMPVSQEEARYWAQALSSQCAGFTAEVRQLAPWLANPDAGAGTGDGPGIPSLQDLARLDRPESSVARARIRELERLVHVAGQCAQMDHRFLYDGTRHLLSIGYNVDDQRIDAGYYDLLASEARLGSFVAIAQGQLPQESWFALGRLLTEVDGAPTLLSWSGSMFEYLMPQLVMPSYPGTLLDHTARHSVERQIEYGRQRDVPWGISESGYNLVDARMNYQYRAFGVPGLGLKRGLAQDLVVAPYASMMALMVAPEAACQNLERLWHGGFGGRLGLYEAIDYTPSRVPRGQSYALVRSYMAHHQGMGFLALAYLLRDQPMQRRFAEDPEFRATLLLLQERIPRTGVFHPHSAEVATAGPVSEVETAQLRVFRSADTVRPAVQILSNGRYHVMLTSAGGGYSRRGDMAVTRWREDGTRDALGQFCFLRDVDSGEYWSTAHQPTGVVVPGYEAIFSDAKAEFRGRQRGYESHMEIAVSPEDEIELRRLHISNRGRTARTIEITTYAEVVLASALSDELHPAFSNLFVQTTLVPAKQAIVCTRRPRAHDDAVPWMFHLVAVHDADIAAISYETDRARFIGRGNTLRDPDALVRDALLSNSEGSVLDPIVAARCRIALAPGQTAIIDTVTGVGDSRADCDELIDKYRDRRLADRVFDLAWTHNQVVRRQIDASEGDAQLYERLAGMMLFSHPALRAEPAVLLQNRRGQSGLWGQSISGDHPIALVRITDSANIGLVRQMVQAHAYWRLKGLAVDLVIWNEDHAGYRQHLQDQIMGLVAAGVEAHVIDRPGGIFVRQAQQLSQEDRILLQSVARVIITDTNGSLAEQVARRTPPLAQPPLLSAAAASSDSTLEERDAVAEAHVEAGGVSGPAGFDVAHADPWPFEHAATELILDNGLGGFSADGREYIIRNEPGQPTPAPWSNVLANAQFGCVLSDSTPGYTWSENAHEFRLTPWHNDPIGDTSGEAFYLRDEDTGRVWSPMPLPARGSGAYRTRHGFGYSVYEHVEDGIESELWVYVALNEPVKYSVLKLRNRSGRTRRISATAYVEWILGDLYGRTHMYLITEVDGDSELLTARNTYNAEFGQRVAFLDADVHQGTRSFTGDRTEFLGRNGTLRAPAALQRERLSNRTGPGLDPCAAIQLPIELDPGQSFETVFRLGVGRDWGDAVALAKRCRGSDAAHDALDAVRLHWTRALGTVQVQTSDPAIDVLANGWLLYQTIACRYLARSGYYQSGGAFGFRDQLQDTMAMVHAQPTRAREHLLLAAAHQFPEGDVLHWWHPPLDRGVRTRCSDDFLWLPLAAARYVEVTGDAGVLDQRVPYIEGRPVAADEESYYDLPTRSALRESLYRHCVRALQRGMSRLGERGLPLIATGDWNDGMNRVGEGGRGESVWLGFFLFEVLNRFAPLARARGEIVFAETCEDAADALRGNLEAHAWDGAWYRRGWFDNGAPLGSSESDECNIDSIAQSWSVLSGAGDRQRSRQALASLDQRLVRREAGLIQLLDPPFDKTAQDPGYIRGYLPGVRENGGQYTHAAIWATMAFARIGDADKAWELLRMINPVNHAADAAGVATYKVEPYVVAADVYAVAPHVGRGGWTWYTGSAGWMYRLIVESLLGLQRAGNLLRITPCLPAEWSGYRMQYRYGETTYRIDVRRDRDAVDTRVMLDAQVCALGEIALVDDRREHRVEVVLGHPAAALVQ